MSGGAGRDARGRFAPGWKGGPGRPRRQVEDDYLKALCDTVAPTDIVEIAKRAVEDAKKGDSRARDWLSRYLLPERSCVASGGGGEQRFIVHIPAGVRSGAGEV